MADSRIDILADMFKPQKTIYAEVKYWDVPAATGEGGSSGIAGQYLNLLQSADALLVLVRAFNDPSVPHTTGSVDPRRDLETIQAELTFSDLAILERRLARIETEMKSARSHDREVFNKEMALLQRVRVGLDSDVSLREQELSSEEILQLSNYQFLTGKPVLIVFNADEDSGDSCDGLIADLPASHESKGIAATSLCAKLEMELTQLAVEDETEFRKDMGLIEPGLDRVVRLSYQLLGLLSFFTVGADEVRAWTIDTGTLAVKAAGKIHTDLERGFIRAEVVAYDELVRCGSLAQVKKQGRLRLEGKTYVVQDGDVMNVLFNV